MPFIITNTTNIDINIIIINIIIRESQSSILSDRNIIIIYSNSLYYIRQIFDTIVTIFLHLTSILNVCCNVSVGKKAIPGVGHLHCNSLRAIVTWLNVVPPPLLCLVRDAPLDGSINFRIITLLCNG